jgi:general nucleoside transport system permease protein
MTKKSLNKQFKDIRTSILGMLGGLLDPVTAIILALFVGGIIIALLGDDVVLAISSLLKGSLGSFRSFGQSLLAATPLIFTGLSFSVAYRSGLFNIGAEGQLYVGAIVGAMVGTLFPGLPSIIYIPLVLISGAVAGALWAFLPAYLKVRLGVHEVINVIMLNKIALYLTNWLVSVNGPFRLGSVQPATPFMDDNVRLQALFKGSPMNIAYAVGIAMAIIVYLLMWKTKSGYRMRAVGHNLNASQFVGINTNRSVISAFMISGALAGMGGAIEICSVYGRFYAGFSPGYGFEGIAVSLLGNNHPVGIIISSILFGALKTGAMKMQIIAGTNVNLVKVLQALIIFFVAGKWSILATIKNQKEQIIRRRLAKKIKH